MAYDNTRRQRLADLRKILIWSSLFSIWVVVLLSYFFADNAIKPITDIIARVKKINHSHLSTRLDEGNKRDEIAQLSITFNRMLSDLEIAFKNQADFVSNASHELRTPLSIMISESDYILGQEQPPEIYREHIWGIVNDLKKLNSQLNTLLELAQMNKEQPVEFAEVRIDETIFSAIQIIKAKYPGRRITPQIDYPDNEQELLINGNYGMLVIAFSNLIDNACKFSKEVVNINVSIDDRFINVMISDKGMGIPRDELDKIHQPFHRASNVKFIGGFGIGLSLVARILDLHQTKSKISSTINEGTRIELRFEKLNSPPATEQTREGRSV
jgi:signal transduction histidine kinase